MDVRLDAPAKFSHLKPGDELQGKVTQNVFSGYRLLAPRGSQILLTVSGMKRGARTHNSIWPWPVRYFLPRYRKVPVIGFADVISQDGRKMRLPVSVVAEIDSTHVTARSAGAKRSGGLTQSSAEVTKRIGKGENLPGRRLEVVIDAGGIETASVPLVASAGTTSRQAGMSGIKTLQAGTEANLALFNTLSASKSRAGDQFKALLVQPMRLNSGELLPEGTVFEGHITRSVPPRWLSRPGSLYVTFTRLVLPAGTGLPIAASVAGVDVSQWSRIKVNAEGGMSGGSPGKARLLLELGVGAGISKAADDSYQLIAELLISSATDASTAGTARLIGFAFTGLYMLTRRGRDVTLPRYTPITIRFDRLPSLPSPESAPQREITR
jgi:hypothetical protein